MIKKVIYTVLLLIGIFMILGEVLVRIPINNVNIKYGIYYFIPIRIHFSIALAGVFVIIYLVAKIFNNNNNKKICLLLLTYLCYITLFIDTILKA